MKKNEHLAKCYLALERLSTFLKTYQDLMNVCMVDFITKDVFENILSPDIKDDLNRLTDDDIRLFHENSMRFTQVCKVKIFFLKFGPTIFDIL